MFHFRLINMPDGNQVIDTSLKTPYESLTVEQLQEYIKVDEQLSTMESLEKKRKAEIEHKNKLARNPLYKLACRCGIC